MAHRGGRAGRAQEWARVGYWTAEVAREALEAWRSSGGSMAGFARRHGLNAQRLGWWRKRLGGEAPGPRIEFVPVRLPVSEATGGGGEPGSLEVVLAGGRRIRVTSGFEESALVRLVRALEGVPC